MRRFWLRSLLLGLVLLQALPGAAAPTPTAAGLEAAAIEVDLDHDLYVARGDASFTYRGLTLHADSITADRSTGELEAGGNLELVQGARRLRGESLRYNITTEEGVLTQARVAEQGVFITGEEVVFSPTRLLARQAQFTTCDHADPHYSFGADTIELTAEEVRRESERRGAMRRRAARSRSGARPPPQPWSHPPLHRGEARRGVHEPRHHQQGEQHDDGHRQNQLEQRQPPLPLLS